MPATAILDSRVMSAAGPEGKQPDCGYEDLGRVDYLPAWDLQRELVEERKRGRMGDRLLFVEHPHVVTMGRSAKAENLLLMEHEYEHLGIDLQHTDRGGDVTYHGPGQIVGYPILDLREWKRDVVAYVRALEQVLIDAVRPFGIAAGRLPGCTGVWVDGAKLASIGVHISRWVTSHGFALNVAPQMEYFRHIIPCGLRKPLTSMERLIGDAPPREEVLAALVESFGRVFGCRMERVNRPRLTGAVAPDVEKS